jgi:hypothetical protein
MRLELINIIRGLMTNISGLRLKIERRMRAESEALYS